jgi:hypothetical protein
MRARSEAPGGGTSAERWLEMYPGGWQTLFPNGGDEAEGYGFHGSACLAPYSFDAGDTEVTLRAEVAGFSIERNVSVRADGVDVVERITNLAARPRNTMWSHHPAFGAPLISGDARVECGARTFVADDARDVVHGDLQPGARSVWPQAVARDGAEVDLRLLPPDGAPLDRFGYCTGFDDGWATIVGTDLDVRLEWDARVFPCAWYWLEARATTGAPWFGEAYVFAIEPASTWPGRGLANARVKGNGPLTFAPGETIEAPVSLTVTPR